MTRSSYRWMTAGLLAGGCAGLMGMTSVLGAGVALGEDTGTALIMGYVMTPDPGEVYRERVMDLFVDPAHPFPGQPVYPYTPVIEPLNPSNYQQSLLDAAQTLNQDIAKYLEDGPVTVFGVSSTTALATQAMIDLAQEGSNAPDPADLHFVLVEDLNSPNGGIFTRFADPLGLNPPPTPVDTPYTTDIYNFEYSGAADYPNYPLNPLALLNSMAGYVYLHPYLITGYPSSFDPDAMADAVKLPMSEGYDGDTSFYLIPTMNLPLLEPLRQFPLFGPAMADLVQPALRVLIDLGYDRSDPADITTLASWSMPTIDWDTVTQNLELGFEQGWTAAQVDLGMLPESELPDLYPYLPDLSGLIAG